MIDDEHHEAHGAMIHRGLVDERTKGVNYHGKQKEALDVALNGIRNARSEFKTGYPNDAEGTLSHTLTLIEEILK
jgi:hypothetical protein